MQLCCRDPSGRRSQRQLTTYFQRLILSLAKAECPLLGSWAQGRVPSAVISLLGQTQVLEHCPEMYQGEVAASSPKVCSKSVPTLHQPPHFFGQQDR